MTDPPASGRPVPVLLMVRSLTAGGTERQLTELAKALDRKLFSPHVACFTAQGFRADELRACGVPLLDLSLHSLLGPDALRAARQLRAYFREHSIALVHTFDYPSNIFGVPVAKLSGIPCVLAAQRGYRKMYDRKYRLMLRASDALADGIVANCEAMRRHLADDCSIPERKIELCFNGLDTRVFHPAPRCRPPALADASLVIGAVSVLRPAKGIPCLLDAFALVRAARPGVRLLVVGGGPDAPALSARADALGLGDSCIFEPATNDVVPWLHALDIFVLPSVSEALSNSLMEAMACGCCSVASRVGGNPELIRDEENGLLFEVSNPRDLADRLIRLIDAPALRGELAGRAAGAIAARFSLESSVRSMQEIYRRFLDRR
jgi:L-malate glycosyltransferase